MHFGRILFPLLITIGVLVAGRAPGEVFLVPDPTADVVHRVNSAGVKTNLISTGLNTPEQAIADGNGNFYVADSGLGQVLRYPAAGGGPVQVGDAAPGVQSLAFDAAGTLYVACATDRTIRKLNAQNAFQIVVTLDANAALRGIAFGPDGHLFVADNTVGPEQKSRIYDVNPAGTFSVFSDDVISPYGVAFDSAGKLHASDADKGGRIVTFNPNGKSMDVSTGLGAVRGIGLDRANIASFLTSGGELRKVTGKTSSDSVATGLGDARLLTVRAPVTTVIAFKGKTLNQPNDDPAGGVISTMASPAIGGGAVAFKGTLLPGSANGSVTAANSLAMWRTDANGALTLLARKGKSAPGLSGAELIAALSDPVVNHQGKVAFASSLLIGTGDVKANNAKAVFSDATGTLAPVLRGSAPGFDPAVKFTSFGQVVLPNDAGPAVLATIAGPTITAANNLGLWSVDATGTAVLVVRKGDPVTFTDPVTLVQKTRKIATLGLFTPTPFALGQGRHFGSGRKFTMLAKFTDGYFAILLVQPGMVPVVLAEKNGLVGPTLAQAKFASFGSPCVSADASLFAFLGKLVPNVGPVTLLNAVGIFTQENGVNSKEAQKAFSAPGVQNAVYSILGDPVMNAGGAFAFLGRMKPGVAFGGVLASDSAGIWADYGAGLGLVARQGRPAPGIAGTVKFTVFRQLALPNTGGVVFTASVAGTNITAANNLGVWADDGTGGLELILRKGDKVNINNQLRVVTGFTVLNSVVGVAGQSRHFDANGDIVLSVVCLDGMRAILTFQRP
jgi:hypothetical protein